MNNINKQVTDNFHTNIAYISQYHPAIFKKLSALDSAIQNGHYIEKYELVYENENFDVLEKETNSYLYSKKNSFHATNATESVNCSIDNSLFEGFEKHSFTQNEIDSFKNDKTFNSHLPSIADIINYINNNTPINKNLNSIYKFIFFGTGLGLHIEMIHEKIKSKLYLIVEDDLELFRLSLFTCNYEKISKKAKIFFSIFEDQNESIHTFNNFIEEKYQYNHYLKYFHLLSHSETKINEFHIALTSQAHLRFLFHNLFKQYMQPLNYFFNDYSFLHKNINFNSSSFNNIPFLILAMGPSLEKNIQWLKKNQKKFITVAVSSTLSYLEQEKIVPNIILHIDPFEFGDISFKKLRSIDFIKNSICLFSTATPKNISSLINKDMLYFFETGTSYKTDSLKLSSPCVGSLAYQLLLVLNIKNIYILGLDLAVDNRTNTTHSSFHQFNKKIENHKNSTTYKNTLIEVDGNKVKKVKTTPHFNASLQAIEYFVPKLKNEEQSIYNLSSGAKLSGATTKKCADLNTKDIIFLNFQEELKTYLDFNSSNDLTFDERNNFSKKLEHAKKLENKINNGIDLFNIVNYLNLNISSKSTELDKILNAYLRYILSYIYNFFNYKNLEKKDQHINYLNLLLAKKLLNIIQYYINILQNKLK